MFYNQHLNKANTLKLCHDDLSLCATTTANSSQTVFVYQISITWVWSTHGFVFHLIFNGATHCDCLPRTISLKGYRNKLTMVQFKLRSETNVLTARRQITNNDFGKSTGLNLIDKVEEAIIDSYKYLSLNVL